MTLLIIPEKESARKKFSRALLGDESKTIGDYNGQRIQIISAAGHLMEYLEPHEMVDSTLTEKYKSWDIRYLPWNTADLSYYRKVSSGKEKRLDNIKKASKYASAIVIATDLDPTGEGDLIGQEIVDAIGWTGRVLRLPFVDESEKSIQKGFSEMYDVSNKESYSAYLKSESRARFDFNSIQVTRAATYYAKQQGLNKSILRNGRLKSVIIRLVFEQEQRRERYVKRPVYEVQFKDNNGHVYKRKEVEDANWRFPNKNEVNLSDYTSSSVRVVKKERKTSSPPKLYVLDKLVSEMAPLGYKSKEVKEVYQRMYEDEVVSYPRTEDNQITEEQFNELLPHIDRIAKIVDIQTNLLTHREKRSTHVKTSGLAHGANRPGLNIPESLDDLEKYDGKKKGCAEIIYKKLAIRYLAMFGEDYVFDSVIAQVDRYPDFQTQVSIPVSFGYKEIVLDDNAREKEVKGIGEIAEPFVAEIINKKPVRPTSAWLTKQLEKLGVGTPATRTETIVQMVNDKIVSRQLNETVGKKQSLSTTLLGQINAVLLKGSYIADPESTKNLWSWMEQAGEGKRSISEVADTCTLLVEHDISVFQKNASNIPKYLEYAKKRDAKVLKEAKALEGSKRIKVNFNGEEIALNTVILGDREATEEELEELLVGKTIRVQLKSKKNQSYQTNVKIQHHEKYGWGIAPVDVEEVTGLFNGVEVSIKPTFSTHVFSDEEMEKLFNGEIVGIILNTKKGVWKPNIKIIEKNGEYVLDYIKEAPKNRLEVIYDGKTIAIPNKFMEHVLTDDEIDRLLNKQIITVKTKTKKGKTWSPKIRITHSDQYGWCYEVVQ